MTEKTNTNKIYSALIKARAEFKPVIFDKVNPHYKNRFASLAAINEAIVEPLAKYGLTYIQPWHQLENGDMVLETIILHESGESIKSSCLIKSGKTDQQLGASSSYMRRYQLSSLLGIVGEDEDDGESDEGRVNPPLDIKSSGISDKQKGLLSFKLKQYPDLEEPIMKAYNLKSVYDIGKEQFQKVMQGFEKRDQEKI